MSTLAVPRVLSPCRVVRIPADRCSLLGELSAPDDPIGVIVFAKTDAARRSPDRDQELADALHDARFATLVLDLLTPIEEIVDEPTRGMRTDLGLLSRRLVDVIDWLSDQPESRGLAAGIFGEGPGGPAALVAACVRPERVAAVVCLTERLDPATPALGLVEAPSLIIVSGSADTDLLSNESALRQLHCPKQLVRVPSDQFTHDDDADSEISRLVRDWFSHTMTPGASGDWRR